MSQDEQESKPQRADDPRGAGFFRQRLNGVRLPPIPRGSSRPRPVTEKRRAVRQSPGA